MIMELWLSVIVVIEYCCNRIVEELIIYFKQKFILLLTDLYCEILRGIQVPNNDQECVSLTEIKSKKGLTHFYKSTHSKT